MKIDKTLGKMAKGYGDQHHHHHHHSQSEDTHDVLILLENRLLQHKCNLLE